MTEARNQRHSKLPTDQEGQRPINISINIKSPYNDRFFHEK